MEPEAPAEELRRVFPEQAAHVLEAADGFELGADGFRRGRLAEPAIGGLDIVLPRDARGAVRLRLPDGLEIQVREVGIEGDGRPAEQAVAYPRAGGTSFWTAAPGGFEEWLHLEAGVARAGEAAATWEIEGAHFRQSGEVVLVVDATGAPRLQVAAPRAYLPGGREVEARLHVRQNHLDLFVDAAGEAVLIDPAWTVTSGAMLEGRHLHTATLLGNGKVLVTGGDSLNGVLTTAELYDPALGTWSVAGMSPMSLPRELHAAALLDNGKVLVTGGDDAFTTTNTAELYDPGTTQWTAAGTMNAARSNHTATLLLNGKVLVAGGTDDSGYIATSQLYDPATGWSMPVPLFNNVPRAYHTATRLSNGKVLVAGGATSGGGAVKTADLYDPATDTWSATGQMTGARYFHAAAQLPNGKVLVTGGAVGGTPVSTAELYDPAGMGTWSAVPSMPSARRSHTATLLGNGFVLVAGGLSGAAATSSAFLFDPAASTWTPTVSLQNARSGHAATRLQNGAVLVSGGNNAGNYVAVSELYALDPNGTTCVGAATCASGLCVDGVCCNAACGGTCEACNLMGTSGTCSPIPAGQDPANECTGNGGTDVCNGAGACREVNGTPCMAGAECLSGHCIDGVCCNAACGGTCQACNLMGSIGTCSPIPAGQDPAAECPGSINCNGAGACNNLLPNGTLCMAGAECQSGNCIDGVCCNAACGGGCQACDLPGSTGVCTNIPAGQDPDNECPGANACTGAGACDSLSPDGAPCVSGAACLSGHCADGVCCNAACNAGPCDACSVAAGAAADGTCALLTGTPCNDGDACTQTDVCQAGLCTGANPKTCPPMNACQDAGTCDPVSGTCLAANKPDGTPCTDSSVCTQGDGCQAGACVPGPPVMCTPSDLCHVAGVCDPASGCSDPVKPLDCSAQGPCELDGGCDPATGLCDNPPKPDGTLCPGGFCSAGACQADSDGDEIADAFDKCPDTFDPDQNDQDGDGLGDPCDDDLDGDGDPNAEDNCPTIANPDQKDTNGDNVGDACECAPPKTAGSPCDDGNLCTLNDTCDNAGACVPGPTLTCPLAGQRIDVCQVSVCFVSVGACSVLDKSDGATCPGGTCIAGGCYVDSPPGTGGSGGTASGGAGAGGATGGGGGDATSSTTGAGGSTGTGTTDGAGGGSAGGSAATSSGGAGGVGGAGNDELRLHGGCSVSRAPESAPLWWLLVSLPMLRRRKMFPRRYERKEKE